MVRRPGLDHSAHLPLELKLDVLSRLSKDDLLHASSVSQMWRAAGRLDPRFIVHVCACTPKREQAITARNNGRVVQMDSFEHARRLKLRVALAYDAWGYTTHCGCTMPKRVAPDDWLNFSRYVQPVVDRLVRLHIVTGSSMPQGGLFDLDLPVLHDFRLKAKRSLLSSPATVPRSIFNLGAPALRAVHLTDLAMVEVVPAFRQVTTLTLKFTDRCAEPERLISLESFSNLHDVTIIGSMDIDSDDQAPVNWFKQVAWLPTGCPQLSSLSLINVSGVDWDNPSVSLPGMASLRYDIIPDDWTEHVDSFLWTVLPPAEEPLHVLLFTRDRIGLIVAHSPKSANSSQSILRVLMIPDPQQINSDPDLGLHEPFFQSLTTLTIQLQRFFRYDITNLHHFPYLRTLNLLLDADCSEYPTGQHPLSDCEECSDVLRCPGHDDFSAHYTIPRLEFMSLVGYGTRRVLSSEVAWQLFRTMGVFVRPKPATLVLNLCGVVVQRDSNFNKFASLCCEVNEEPDATFSSNDIDKWTGPTWYNARL